jgi:hypothetical protein
MPILSKPALALDGFHCCSVFSNEKMVWQAAIGPFPGKAYSRPAVCLNEVQRRCINFYVYVW